MYDVYTERVSPARNVCSSIVFNPAKSLGTSWLILYQRVV